ncbi:hypothetical protein CRYUN_Cryun37aG0028500 [Craigia yunnanensis]
MGLAKSKRAVVFLMMIMVGISGLSMAAVYKVGDSAGWTILGGGLDYQDWAATKNFFVGDILDMGRAATLSPLQAQASTISYAVIQATAKLVRSFTSLLSAASPPNPAPIPPAINVAPSPYTSKLSYLAMTVAVIPPFLLPV